MNKTILLVDDSNAVLLMEKLLLKRGQYRLVEAHDGEEALAVAEAEKPDLILMDVIMPKMGGFEACRAMRRMETTRDTPIILVTTRAEAENVQNGFECGCNDYVIKPINGVELVEKVNSHLGA